MGWGGREGGGDGSLPTVLGGVRVKGGSIFAPLLYVSPTQVNFIVPTSLSAGQTNILLTRCITDKPITQITLLEAAPALFEADSRIAAEHPDGSVISVAAAAHPSQATTISGTGLGRTETP